MGTQLEIGIIEEQKVADHSLVDKTTLAGKLVGQQEPKLIVKSLEEFNLANSESMVVGFA